MGNSNRGFQISLETVAPVAIEGMAPRDGIKKALEGGGAL